MERPLGVTILAILYGIVGVFLIAVGVFFTAMLSMITGMMPSIAHFMGLMGIFMALILFVIGILNTVVAWGLWSGMKWAWFLAIILSLIGLLNGILSLLSQTIVTGVGHPHFSPGIFSPPIIQIIIEGIILYYLTRPHVRKYFK
ncbi:MAG: hypothetical protein DRJ47_10720 [Thermoprotei archaeon]|nr:MAG: hypothetical protein DRJ47_10720 [Thermoprotei archaeon]